MSLEITDARAALEVRTSETLTGKESDSLLSVVASDSCRSYAEEGNAWVSAPG